MVFDGIIQGVGIRLRSVETADAEFLHCIRQDKERTRFLHRYSGTLEDQREWIRQQRKRPGDYYFLVEDREGTALGTVSLYNIADGRGEIGRMLINGTCIQNCDAIVQIRRFAFEIIAVDSVQCTVATENKTVLHQVRQFGGVWEGNFVDPADGAEKAVFTVTRQAYEARRDRFAGLVQRCYAITENRDGKNLLPGGDIEGINNYFLSPK